VGSAIAPLIVCVASAAGALVGVALRFPRTGTALIYPPYAIVTAALLMSPPRRWWIYLVAGSAGTFWPHRLGGASLGFIFMADVANYARALLAAGGVRSTRTFASRGLALDTLRGMAAFLFFAAVTAPIAGAILGAAVVAFHRGAAAYWTAWGNWLLSNVLTGLTLLPIILLAPSAWAAARRMRWTVARGAEAGIFLLSLLAVGGLVLLGPPGFADAWVPLYAPVPVLLWAAVRFGPGATSASLLVVAVLAIAGTISGRGPFYTSSPAVDLIRLQVSLVFTAVPLLLLSALLKERQRTGEALRASQSEYAHVVEDETDMICRLGPGGALTFVNEACCRRSGRTRQELLGTDFWSLLPLAARERGRRMLDGLGLERPVVTWEDRGDGTSGPIRWEQWRVRALFDGQGSLSGYQALGRDVTEQKRADDQRSQLQSEHAMAEALREADRRKDEFVAMVAHELRNPLAPIAIAVETLGQPLTATDEETSSAYQIIRRQTAHLSRLVDDLLDLSRIRNGTFHLQTGAVELAAILADAVETSTPAIERRGIELVRQLPDDRMIVWGDRTRLVQLFSNLLNNAAKYSPGGGRVDLTMSRDGDGVTVSVKDRGAGIPAHMLDRVFESFAQVDRSRDVALGGLGLGLALAKRIVELHGGAIRAESDGPGAGTVFVVRLPVRLPSVDS
jgi:PAS domain S-box-containing protein